MRYFITCFTLAIFIVYCQADGPNGPNGCPFLRGIAKEDFTKCLDEVGLTKDELKALHASQAEPNEKQLCLAKCTAIAVGYIDKDGMIVPDLIKKNVPSSVIDDDTMKTALACMVAAGKVTTCDDMSKILKCAPKPPKKTK